MSVTASKRGTGAINIKPTAHTLYKKVARLVLDPEVVPKQLTSEFKHPVLNTMRDMLSHIAVAGACDIRSGYTRRRNHWLHAHDLTVILDDQISLLMECRNIQADRVEEILRDNYTISRGIKQIMQSDRKEIDASLKSKSAQIKEELSREETASLIKDASKKITKGTVDAPSELIIEKRSKDMSLKELRKKALEQSPEFTGIINNPTDPESPVLDHVREIQKMRSDAAEEQIRATRNHKSSR